MSYHIPSNNSSLPEEKGKLLDPKTKLLTTTVRKVVLAILDDKKQISLKLQGNKSHALNIEGIVEKEFSTHKIKGLVKESVHNALKIVGVHSKKRIRNALETLGGQYKNMSDERFLHRIKNGKVERDCKFLIGMMRFMGQLGEEGLASSVNILLLNKNFQSLDKSDSRKALKYLILKAKEVLENSNNKSKVSYGQFEEMLRNLAKQPKNKKVREN